MTHKCTRERSPAPNSQAARGVQQKKCLWSSETTGLYAHHAACVTAGTAPQNGVEIPTDAAVSVERHSRGGAIKARDILCPFFRSVQRTRLEKPGGKYPSEKSLFIDGFAPPSPPMATVFALVLETAFTSVRRSARRVAPFPLICPPILPRDPAPRTSLHGTTGMSVRLAHMLWCSHTARHCPEPPALSL